MSEDEQKPGKIYKCICDIQAEIGAVAKSQVNKSQGFNYRGVDQAQNALYPLLVKHRCFMVPKIIKMDQVEREMKSGAKMFVTTTHMRYRVTADDGSYVDAESCGEGADQIDKGVAKSQSVAMKVAVWTLFCVPTEMPDPDSDEQPVDGDPVLAKTVYDAVHKTVDSKSLNNLVQRYEARKVALSTEQREKIDTAIADRIKSFAGAK